MKIRKIYTLIQIPSCFRAFPMIWNVASTRDEISLRKWSGSTAPLRITRGSIGCKKCILLAASFSLMFLYT